MLGEAKLAGGGHFCLMRRLPIHPLVCQDVTILARGTMRLVAAFASAVMLICLGVSPGHSQARVALVMGNSAYQNVPALPI